MYVTGWAAVGIPVVEIRAMVVVGSVRSDGLERPMPTIIPGPCSIGYDVVKKGMEIDVVEVVVGEYEGSGFLAEFGQ